MLVSAYIVETGLIMDSNEVPSKLMKSRLFPAFIEQFEEGELSFPLMPLAPKTTQIIVTVKITI
jgi:hypothetical protein